MLVLLDVHAWSLLIGPTRPFSTRAVVCSGIRQNSDAPGRNSWRIPLQRASCPLQTTANELLKCTSMQFLSRYGRSLPASRPMPTASHHSRPLYETAPGPRAATFRWIFPAFLLPVRSLAFGF